MATRQLGLVICLLLGFGSSVSVGIAAGKPSYDKKMQVGQLLYFNGNVEQAIKAFKTAESLKPAAVEPRLSLVNIYVQKGEVESAIEECREILKIKPNHKDIPLILGNLLRTQAGNSKSDEEKKALLKEAKEQLDLAAGRGADPALIENTMGVIEVQSGNFDKAEEHIDNALKKRQALPDAHLIKGVLRFKKGDKEASLKHLDLAVKHKGGKHAEARCTKGDILFSMGKQEEALEEYKKAADDDSRHHPAYSGMGNILIAQKKYDEALEHLEKARAIKPEDKNVLYSLAVCYEKMGKTQDAVRLFNEGLMLETDPLMKGQIQLHVQQLQQHTLFNLPQILNPAAGPQLTPGGSLEGFNESFKDLIKIGGKKKE